MELIFELEDKKNIEKFLLIISLGLLEGLKKKLISLEDAESYIFDPYLASSLEKSGISNSLSELIYWTCELENVKRLIPESLDESCNDIIKEIEKKMMGYIDLKIKFNYILKNKGFLANKKDSM